MNTTSGSGRSASSSEDKELVGWVLESPDRGTLSLIATCLFTTFLCTWAIIHPRVTRNRSRRLCHKLALCLKTIIAPEFIAVEGLQEWSQARNTVKQCEHFTSGELDLVHGFYIGMLALRYRTERGEKVIWPNQYHWLFEQKLIDWKDHQSWGLSKESIRDKSNADTAVKAFALLQVSWFVAQGIMRTAHNLPLSQLESMTLSYVPLFLVTAFFWWSKPKDVITPSVVDLPEMSTEQKITFEDLSVDATFDDEHTDNQDSWLNIWKLTPRVFEKEAKEKGLEEIARRVTSEANVGDELESQQTIEPQENRKQANPIKRLVTGIPLFRNVFESRRQNIADRLHVQEAANPRTPTETTKRFSAKLGRAETDTRFIAVNQRYADAAGPTESSSQRRECVLLQHSSETVLAYWDPQVYRSKIWPIACLFGASFGALHLTSWHTVFPTVFETWLWRIAAITSMVSMLIFMQYEKVILRWGGPLTLLSIVSPAVYLISRIVMIAGVIAAFRGMDPKIYETYVVSTYWIHLV